MGTQQFCLKWNNHSSNMLTIFEQLLSSEALVDVTLACDGLSLKAHKMVLSACSPFFHSLFLENPCKHPVVILKDIKYNDLKAVIDFMYRGEVNVSQDRLSALLQTAETLKIKGLAEVGNQQTQGSSDVIQQEITQQPNSSIDIPRDKKLELPVFRKRKRGRPRRCSLSDSNRSDTEEPLASKVKIADSLEVSNSITKDDSDSSIEIQPIANVSNHSQSQISIHSITLCTNSEDKNLENMKTAIQVSNVTTEDGPSDDETEFEMEPSRLMEQTLTTDNITTFSDGQSQDSCLPSISAQPSMTSTAECIEPSLQNCDTNSNGQALVPCSLPPETFTSAQSSRDDSQDIKPRALLSFEEPKISLPAGSSHYDDNALMMYMDTSGVPAVPGPSNYQLDKQSQILHHSQGFLERNISHHSTRYPKGVYACAFCNKRFSSKYYLRQHIQLHTPFRKKYRCNQCGKEFNWNQDLLRHGRNVHGNPSQGRKMTAVV